jgi:hypothetical protein
VTQLHPDAEAIFKDSYLVDFLDLPEAHSEQELQTAIIVNLKRFLLELGRDFAFVGEQYLLPERWSKGRCGCAERPLYALAPACGGEVRRSAGGRDEPVADRTVVASASGSTRPPADIRVAGLNFSVPDIRLTAQRDGHAASRRRKRRRRRLFTESGGKPARAAPPRKRVSWDGTGGD